MQNNGSWFWLSLSQTDFEYFLDGQLPMVLQVVKAHDNSLGCSEANNCHIGAEA